MLIMCVFFLNCLIKIVVAMVTEIVKMLHRLEACVLWATPVLVTIWNQVFTYQNTFPTRSKKIINILVNNLTSFTVYMAFSTFFPGLL